MHRLAPQLIPVLLILGATLAVYSGAFGNDFLVNWDDPTYVSANPDVQSFTLENLRKIFTSFYAGNYAPLQMLSYMFDYQLWGANPFGFILVNVLLHGLNGILFYLLLGRLGLTSGWALLAALLFVVHPVQVESVAWISQRKNLLAMTFFLAAFWQYQAFSRYREKRWIHYAATNFCFVLALLTKSVVVVFPVVLLVYDVTLRQERGRLQTILAEKVPFVLLAAGASWLTLISQGEAIVKGYHGGSAFATMLTMMAVYKDYLVNLFWPLQLSALYLEDFKTGIDAEVLLSAILLAAWFASLLLFRQGTRRPAMFWLALFALGFVPVSQIIPIMTLMNDRYLYFPMLGFAVYLVLLLQEVAERFRVRASVALALLVACLVLLAPVAWLRAEVWSNSITLWQDTVRKQPQSSWAWSLLGDSQRKGGDYGASIDSYRQALVIDPDYYQYHFELGRVYQHIGEYGLAMLAYRKVLQLNPGHAGARNQLAQIDAEILRGRTGR